MPLRFRVALVVFVTTILAGCSAFGGGEVLFQTTASAYQAGDTVTVRLSNESNGDVGYNLCFATLQVLEEGRWVQVEEDPGFCLSILLGLEPGVSAESQVALPADAQAGDYRVRTAVEVGGTRREVTTNAFAVR